MTRLPYGTPLNDATLRPRTAPAPVPAPYGVLSAASSAVTLVFAAAAAARPAGAR